MNRKSLLSQRILVWLLVLLGAAMLGLGSLCWLSLNAMAEAAQAVRGLQFEISNVSCPEGSSEAIVLLKVRNSGTVDAYLSEIHFNLYAQGKYIGSDEEAGVDTHIEVSGSQVFEFRTGISKERAVELRALTAEAPPEWRVVGRARIRVGTERMDLPVRAIFRSTR